MTSKDDENIVAILERLETQIKSGQRKKAVKSVDEGVLECFCHGLKCAVAFSYTSVTWMLITQA